MVRINKKTQDTPTQDVSLEQDSQKDMFRIGRRSAVSTSELGLYSDHSEYYNTNIYGGTVRKLVIGIMVVVSVILIGIFLYDFASSASISSKVSQETKHIYILQNSFKRSNNDTSRKPIVTVPPTIYIVNTSHANMFEDRLDNDNNLEYKDVKLLQPVIENRAQKIENFQVQNHALDLQYNEKDISTQDIRTIDNHAINHRVRNKLSYSDKSSDISNENNEQVNPFQFELNDPQPSSVRHLKYPQLTQYRYPHTSRNIQDVIKYLTNDQNTLNGGIKFTGFYVNSKKYDTDHIDTERVSMNTDLSEKQANVPYIMTYNSDPLYNYKPKHPSDVNLLATSNFRFSPFEIYTYNSYYNPHQHGSNFHNNSSKNNQYENDGLQSIKKYKKKQKPKPFSVMLDIYPIVDTDEDTNKLSALKSQSTDYESKRPIIPFVHTYSKLYGMHKKLPHPISMQNQYQVPEEDEKHQMILHLNLYPKKKKTTRNNAVERLELLPMDKIDRLIEKEIAPLDGITRRLMDHTEDQDTKLYESKDIAELSEKRYKKFSVEQPQLKKEVKEVKAEMFIGTRQVNDCNNECDISSTAITEDKFPNEKQIIDSKHENSSKFKINTIEKFQQFADSLIAMD